MPSCLCLLIATIAAFTPTAADNCHRMLDLCIVLDSSASVCDSDKTYKKTDSTCSNWNDMIRFIHGFVDTLDIGENATRVGMVIFSTKAYRRWNLTKYMDEPAQLKAIDELQFIAGTTNTSGALDVMMSLVFDSSFKDRPNAAKVALIVTDGRATDPTTVQAAIDRVHAANVTTYVIGVTNQIDVGTLKQLSSDPKQLNKTYFTVLNFNLLSQIFATVQTQICYGDCSMAMDVCFVVDSSASICDSDQNFNKAVDKTCDNWKAIVSFVYKTVQNMDISESASRVGMVVFATKGYRRWNMTRFLNKTSLLENISGLDYIAGETNTSGALNVMMNLVFTQPFGDRPDVRDIAIIITDGRATDPKTVQPAIDRVHAANVTTFVIGVTNQVDEQSLQQLASEPKQKNKTYFAIKDFNALDQILTAVQTQICKVPSNTAT